MKKILLTAAVAALAFVSCTQNEIIETPNQEKAIEFGTYVGKNAVTRATELTSTLDHFYVTAYNTKTTSASNEYNANKSILGVADTKFTRNQEGKYEIEAGKTLNWPENLSQYVNFYAYATSASTALTFTTTTGDNFGKTTATIDGQNDYIFARANQAYAANNTTNPSVALTFAHMVSKIKVSIKTKEDYSSNGFTFGLKEVKLGDDQTNFASSVNVDLVKGEMTASTESNIAVTTSTYTFEENSLLAFGQQNNEAVFVTKENNTNNELLIAPETINLPVSVTYNVYNNNVLIETIKKTITLNNQKFDANKIYTIALVVPNVEAIPIDFTVSNVAWDTSGESVNVPAENEEWSDVQ